MSAVKQQVRRNNYPSQTHQDQTFTQFQNQNLPSKLNEDPLTLSCSIVFDKPATNEGVRISNHNHSYSRKNHASKGKKATNPKLNIEPRAYSLH
jgi:hypothetical protein